MEVTKEHIRHILLYEFNKDNNATESARNIKAVWGSDNKRKPVSTMVPEIPNRKLQPRRRAWKICRARCPANLGGTKSHRNC